MATRKSVYFSEGLDETLLDHAGKFKNFSNYVKHLIMLDRERNLTGKKEETQPRKVQSQGIRLDFREGRERGNAEG